MPTCWRAHGLPKDTGLLPLSGLFILAPTAILVQRYFWKPSLNTLCTIAFLVTKAVRSGGRRVTLTCSLEVRLALSRRPQEAILETRGNVTTGCDVACAQTYNGGDLIAVFDTPFFVKNVRCSRPNPAPRLMILIGDIVIVLLIWICVLVAVLQGSVQKARRSQPRENIHFRLSADL